MKRFTWSSCDDISLKVNSDQKLILQRGVCLPHVETTNDAKLLFMCVAAILDSVGCVVACLHLDIYIYIYMYIHTYIHIYIYIYHTVTMIINSKHSYIK